MDIAIKACTQYQGPTVVNDDKMNVMMHLRPIHGKVWTKSSIDDGLLVTAEEGNDGAISMSPQYAEDLNLSFEDEYHATLEPVNALPLEEVILQFDDAMDLRTFETDMSAKFVGNVMRNSHFAYIPVQGRIVKAKVLSCSPIVQGLVTTGTKIIAVVAPAPDKDKADEPAYEHLISLGKLVFSPTFWGDSLLEKNLHFSLPDQLAVLESAVKYAVIPHELKASHFFGKCGGGVGQQRDMTYTDMANFGLLESQEYFVKGSSGYRVARVHGVATLGFTSDGSGAHPSVLCGPRLYYNLGCYSENIPIIEILPLSSGINSLSTASELTLAVISSPISENQAALELGFKELANWFSQQRRFVSVGDVITIRLSVSGVRLSEILDKAGKELHEDGFGLEPQSQEVIYFKVDTVSPVSEYGISRIDPATTRVQQKGATGSRIPSLLNDDLAGTYYKTNLMFELSRILVSSFHPLASALSLNVSVLLHGASGSGKASTVYAVAEMLHAQVYEVNCFDMVEDAATKIQTEVKKHFDRAVRYSPCILFLRNVDAFGKTEITKPMVSIFVLRFPSSWIVK
ncbi:hypothetical protein BC829DRAFT_274780 [Chytridium lagenaria]|nr:hypothetical protein BC829DRAFT_274780 [Chytridium lagenaria]